ncbi:MAG: endonuclease V [Candidatus Brockarchaeota archaeon]|nr:endonuclease V [Candidatus Brockarchaeota archaeon]
MCVTRNQEIDQSLYSRLCRAQELLSKKVSVSDELLEKVQRIGGVDASYKGESAAVGFSVFDLSKKSIVLLSVSRTFVKMPYVPTFLSFREGPVVLKTLRKFADEYDALIVNGHGLAHPRKCGLATYLGVVLKKPTIGVAKKPLGGLEAEHNVNNLRMFEDRFYYSVGNMITLEGAYSVLKRITPEGFKLPIPLEVAHRLSVKMLEAIAKDAERV